MAWIDKYFDADYLFLYEKNLTVERTKKEVDFLEKYIFDSSVKNVLDIPCGYGRHAELLAERGYSVHGIDNSDLMLRVAEENRRKLSVDVQNRLSYEKGDMRSYDGRGRFNVALNLFTSFGYFDSGEENEAVMQNLCSGVRAGGFVVIDMRNLERDIAEFSQIGWTKKTVRENIEILENLDPDLKRFTLAYLYEKDGEQRELRAIFQEYSLRDLTTMLSKYGCIVKNTFGNFRGEPYGPASSRLIVVAQKRE